MTCNGVSPVQDNKGKKEQILGTGRAQSDVPHVTFT